MQAITVKFIGPTNTRGARYSARCQAGKLTFAQGYNTGIEENATIAAQNLAKHLGWHHIKKWIGGTTHDGNFVFVAATDSSPQFTLK